MELTYHRAGAGDIDLLTETRVRVLRAANGFDDSVDMEHVAEAARGYYLESLESGGHVAYLVLDGKKFIGAGGVSFYRVMPTCSNPSGWKTYVMNIYTHPDYRGRGVAYHTLDLLVREARSRGITAISLETTDMGRPLYEKYGFLKDEREMYLPNR
jgi:ribosomal protein S18 acetylase RimI-like enzyme